ncbi:ERI1 exoribonuclease 2 isoform X2 [Paroedura picta]
MYVQPQEHPILSDFCTELTGITQNQVDEGIPLPICLSQFSKWILKLQQEKKIVFDSVRSDSGASEGKLCAFVTWSDWDLAVCLQYECKRKQLRKPDILNSWIDLRATYKLFYSRKPQGLKGALQDVGIVFAGREHSGLDDSRNTACLAWRMIREGCVMKITKTLDKATPAKNSIARFLTAKLPAGGPLGSNNGVKTSELNKIGDRDGTAVIKDDTGDEQREYAPVCLYESIPGTSRHGSKATGLSKVWGHSTPLADRLGSPIGCLQPLSFGVQSGLSNGHQTANSPAQNAGLVLVSTTLSSVNVSDVEIGTSSDGLSMLADWEDFAWIPASPHGQDSECPQVKDDADGKGSPVSGEGADTRESHMTNLQSEHAAVGTLNAEFSTSIAYKSPNTTIYHKGIAPGKPSDPSVFKLPAAKENTGSMTSNSDCPAFSSSSEAPKRKPSSPQSVPPAKKLPFAVHEDSGASPAYSSRRSGSNQVPCGILNSSTNQNRSLRGKETGKVTPPLCKCGRRARRLQVSKGGPNHGKGFYSCPVGKQEGTPKGCGYFKWEQTLLREKPALPSPTSRPVGQPSPGLIWHSLGNVHNRSLGLRPSMRT